MAATVTEGSNSLALVYDSEHNRIKQCVPNCTSPTATTDYLNDPVTGTMEEKYVAGSTTTWHDYIRADGGIVAERFSTAGVVTWRYFVLDHLGSSSVLTDASGTVQERLSYDAWGKRRNADGSDNTTCSITSATSRGFTGHEMMDSVCLVNANARVYDPSLGRFMSADSVVPDPFNSQSFNRYSYVDNMALSATDPTGHDTGCPQCLPTADPYENGQPCWGCSGPGMDDGQPIVTGYTVTGTYSVDIPFDPSQSGSNTSSSSSSDFGSSDTSFGDTGAGEGALAVRQVMVQARDWEMRVILDRNTVAAHPMPRQAGTAV